MLKLCLALAAVFGTQAALAQERPAAFVDAATVVPGLIVDDALCRFAQFRRPADRRL